MMVENAWDNGSWIRTEGDVRSSDQSLEKRNARLRQEREAKEAGLLQKALELKAARRERTVTGPARVLKQYRNAIRKIGLMAVSEALGV